VDESSLTTRVPGKLPFSSFRKTERPAETLHARDERRTREHVGRIRGASERADLLVGRFVKLTAPRIVNIIPSLSPSVISDGEAETRPREDAMKDIPLHKFHFHCQTGSF